VQRYAIQLLHSVSSTLIAHEADEPVGECLSSVGVSHNSNLINLSILTKYFLQICFSAEFGKISKEERAVWWKECGIHDDG